MSFLTKLEKALNSILPRRILSSVTQSRQQNFYRDDQSPRLPLAIPKISSHSDEHNWSKTSRKALGGLRRRTSSEVWNEIQAEVKFGPMGIIFSKKFSYSIINKPTNTCIIKFAFLLFRTALQSLTGHKSKIFQNGL